MADATNYDALKLKNQLCFPLYAAAREVTRRYTPLLKALGLTYTQYIVMMVLWEKGTVTVGALGKALYLDTGTLSPLLKSMEEKGLVTRARAKDDERVVTVVITAQGEALKERALAVPEAMKACLPLAPDEAAALYNALYKILGGMDNGS